MIPIRLMVRVDCKMKKYPAITIGVTIFFIAELATTQWMMGGPRGGGRSFTWHGEFLGLKEYDWIYFL